MAASFVCGDARCQLFAFNIFRFGDKFGGQFSQLCLRLVITDILDAAIGSTDQATDGGLPDAAQPLAASSCSRQRSQRHELAQGNRVVERSFPAYAILKSRVA